MPEFTLTLVKVADKHVSCGLLVTPYRRCGEVALFAVATGRGYMWRCDTHKDFIDLIERGDYTRAVPMRISDEE